MKRLIATAALAVGAATMGWFGAVGYHHTPRTVNNYAYPAPARYVPAPVTNAWVTYEPNN